MKSKPRVASIPVASVLDLNTNPVRKFERHLDRVAQYGVAKAPLTQAPEEIPTGFARADVESPWAVDEGGGLGSDLSAD